MRGDSGATSADGVWSVPRRVAFRGRRLACATLALITLAGGAARARAQAMPGPGGTAGMMEWGRGSLVLLDELEYSLGQAGRPVAFDALAWVGGAYNRLWLRTDGSQRTDGRGGEGDAEVFFGRLISPYWDALIGARVDGRWGNGDSRARGLLAIGLQGLAPMRFEFAPTLYVSQDGAVSARLEASYQLLLTQRLILEPEVTLNAAGRSAPEFELASGLTDGAVTTRVRYEFRRELAPYLGISWVRQAGGTARLARQAGEPVNDGVVLIGLRVWR